MAAARRRGKLSRWRGATSRHDHACRKLQGECVRRLRSRGQRLGMVRRHLQRREQWNRPRLGSSPRRFLGDKQSFGNAIVVSQRRRSELTRRDLRIPMCAGTGKQRPDRQPIGFCQFGASAARKRSRKGICAGFILRRAVSSGKNSARSISGNSFNFPERGGHSISKRFDFSSTCSGKSPSTAQACTVLPPFCLIEPSGIQFLEGLIPSSSSTSIRARVNKSSLGPASPFGIVHTPSSFLAKNGPPGCASRTWIIVLRRKMSRPALIRLRFCFCGGGESSTPSFNGRLAPVASQRMIPSDPY